MKSSFMDYAMSVIVSRALPDVRDGLKPVHRRILYTQHLTNNVWNRPYIKCARVVGDVLGRFHPHGDTAAYDALVRLAQDFAMRYPLIDGQGNFGSVDGDPPAAYRYTECRMEKIGRRAAGRHRQGDGRVPAQLRRQGAGADGPADQAAQPAGQRRRGHRRGHGHQHPAPQPEGDRHRHHRADQEPGTSPSTSCWRSSPGRTSPPGGSSAGARRNPLGLLQRAAGSILVRGKNQHRGASQERSQIDRRHRDSLPGQQGQADREDRRAGPGQEDRRHLRHPGRVRPRRHAHRHRPEEGRRPRGGAEQPVEDDAPCRTPSGSTCWPSSTAGPRC